MTCDTVTVLGWLPLSFYTIFCVAAGFLLGFMWDKVIKAWK